MNKMTDAMRGREQRLGAAWKDEGNDYFSVVGMGPLSTLAYIALPETHPDVGKDYDEVGNGENDWGPEVNGGLTFADRNVFGWDYGHAYNTFDVEGDIQRALNYFRTRATA